MKHLINPDGSLKLQTDPDYFGGLVFDFTAEELDLWHAQSVEARLVASGIRCEGCDAPATTFDCEQVPLCKACYDDLKSDERYQVQAHPQP